MPISESDAGLLIGIGVIVLGLPTALGLDMFAKRIQRRRDAEIEQYYADMGIPLAKVRDPEEP